MLFHRLGKIDIPDGGYNPSICRHRDRMFCAYRVDRTVGSKPGISCYLGDLTPDLQVRNPVRVALLGEDPRLASCGKWMYCSYATSPSRASGKTAQQVICRIRPDGSIGGPSNLTYAEKAQRNWLFFGLDGRLYAVQSIHPHVVLGIGHGGQFLAEYHTDWERQRGAWLRWAHGSTPPCRIGDRYYAFFHSYFHKTELPSGEKAAQQCRFYYIGAYVFKAGLPFEVLAVTPEPLWGAESLDHRILFPGGAIYSEEQFYVSQGVNNKWGEVISISKAEVDRKLIAV